MVTNTELFRCWNKQRDYHLVPERVYGVRSDKHGYPQFLIYTNNQWRWVSAKHFEPIDTEVIPPLFLGVDLAEETPQS